VAILFAKASFTIIRGLRWDDDVLLKNQDDNAPVDLTGIVGIVLRAREDYNSPIVLELSTDDSTLSITDGANGVLGIRVPSSVTRTLPENDDEAASYVYDAVIERTTGEYEAAIGGRLMVLPQSTRPWSTT
jgi:hypothetical protein